MKDKKVLMLILSLRDNSIIWNKLIKTHKWKIKERKKSKKDMMKVSKIQTA